jgi:hypothetical protein
VPPGVALSILIQIDVERAIGSHGPNRSEGVGPGPGECRWAGG